MARYFSIGMIAAVLSVGIFCGAARAQPAEEIPFKQKAGDTEVSAPRLVFTSLFVVALVAGLVVALRRTVLNADFLGNRFPNSNLLKTLTDKRISLLSVKRITPKISIYLLAVDDKEYLLVDSGGQLQLALHGDGQRDEEQHES